jgi:hypothetical protein
MGRKGELSIICDNVFFFLSCVADPDPGSNAFLTPGSGMDKKSRSGMNIPNNICESLETIFRVKNT